MRQSSSLGWNYRLKIGGFLRRLLDETASEARIAKAATAVDRLEIEKQLYISNGAIKLRSFTQPQTPALTTLPVAPLGTWCCPNRRRNCKCPRRVSSTNGRHTACTRSCLISRCQKRLERL